MADWATISAIATAGGTLVLAVATYNSTRSANATARFTERALLNSQRPVLIPSREDDPRERIPFVDDVAFWLPGHSGIVKFKKSNLYLGMAIRNGGAGLAVIHGWRVETDPERRQVRPEDLDGFRRQTRDMYIPAGSSGFWQGAIRDREDPDYEALRATAERGDRVCVDLLYSDYDGGQRSIVRFIVPSINAHGATDADATQDEDEDGKRIEVLRYWNVDGEDPR
jgi:hypothetical protein